MTIYYMTNARGSFFASEQLEMHFLTIMDLSPRAPVLRSKANLAMARRASGVTLRSH